MDMSTCFEYVNIYFEDGYWGDYNAEHSLYRVAARKCSGSATTATTGAGKQT